MRAALALTPPVDAMTVTKDICRLDYDSARAAVRRVAQAVPAAEFHE